METTLAAIPSCCSASLAASAICTSLPVPMRMTSGSPPASPSPLTASASTYPPRAVSSALASPDAPERSNTGTFCRVRHSPAGPFGRSRMARQATAVSLASAGLTTSRPGMARSAHRCSTGWWVGPSSPRPMESCVQMKVDGSLDSAASRTAPRM